MALLQWAKAQHIKSLRQVGSIVKLSIVHFEGAAVMSGHSNANRAVFVAGATGAIGRQLLPMLIGEGTRSSAPPAIPRRPLKWRRSVFARLWSTSSTATR